MPYKKNPATVVKCLLLLCLLLIAFTTGCKKAEKKESPFDAWTDFSSYFGMEEEEIELVLNNKGLDFKRNEEAFPYIIYTLHEQVSNQTIDIELVFTKEKREDPMTLEAYRKYWYGSTEKEEDKQFLVDLWNNLIQTYGDLESGNLGKVKNYDELEAALETAGAEDEYYRTEFKWSDKKKLIIEKDGQDLTTTFIEATGKDAIKDVKVELIPVN